MSVQVDTMKLGDKSLTEVTLSTQDVISSEAKEMHGSIANFLSIIRKQKVDYLQPDFCHQSV